MKKIVYMIACIAALCTGVGCDNSAATVDALPAMPELLSIIPKAGYAGNTAIVSGSNFSPAAERNTVEIGGMAARIIEASSNRLVITLPEKPKGTYTVKVTVDGMAVEGLSFTYADQPEPPALALVSVLPTKGYAGDEAVIHGTGFSPVGANNKVEINGVKAEVTSATEKMLKIVMPENPDGTFSFNVSVDGQTAGDLLFTYLHRPSLAIFGISPARGYAGDEVTLTGEMFSTTASDNIVKVNGKQAEVTNSSDSVIKFIAPENPAGAYPVEVTVNGTTVGGVEFIYLFGKYTVSTWLGAAGRNTTGETFTDAAPGAVKFNTPKGLNFGPDNSLWIVSGNDNFIVRTDLTTEKSTTVVKTGQNGVTVNSPWRGGFDSKGNYYFANKGAKNIIKVQSQPPYTISVVVTGLGDPLDVDFDSADNMYVVDRGSTNGVVRFAAPDYTTKSEVARFSGSNTIFSGVMDSDDNFYVCVNNTLVKIAPDGTQTVLAGSGTKGASDGVAGEPLTAQFGDMWGVTRDDTGNFYITDGTNHTIRRFSPDENGDYSKGTVETVIGKAGSSGKLDGVGGEARINTPYEVLVSPDGKTMYISDLMNFLIRRVTIE